MRDDVRNTLSEFEPCLAMTKPTPAVGSVLLSEAPARDESPATPRPGMVPLDCRDLGDSVPMALTPRVPGAEPAPTAASRIFGVGSIIGGRYRLVAQLGQGAMAAVYEAEHLLLARRVAIKVLHSTFKDTQEAVTRFHLEAHAAACIAHPNVREVQEAGKLPDGSPYMVMEYLEGCSLADRLVAERRLEIREAIDVLCQVLSALEAAHGRGFIHRDIKPGNVFLAKRQRSWVVKLLDFGASTTRGPGRLVLTGPGKVMGTPLYMAPEQVLGADPDHRVDLYACGAVLYEMLVGVPPFTGSNWCALTENILHSPPPDPLPLRPELPAPLLPILRRSLEKEAARRYQSAELFLADLDGVNRTM